ncbi:hypothetical protein JVX93_09890 [Mycolicibacterium boenickei]|nr:hypothetical protein JVX93_09890 [Mycolicibacterium boenickei]
MSLPPPPGSFGSVPPNGGGGPSWGGQPQQQGQPYGAPYPGQPGGQWGSPEQWAGGPPPNKGGKGKWILVGLALIAIIAVSIVGTVLVLRGDSGGNGSTLSAQNGNSDFASANDTGPANLITEDPTCEAWTKIARDHYDKSESVKWSERDPNVPASSWTAGQRDMYDTVAKSLENAADQARQLAKKTPHRVMREIYGQFVAYASAFIDKIPSYAPDDNKLVIVVGAFTTAPADICSAIKYGSVQPVAPLVAEPAPPSQIAPFDGTDTSQFLAGGNAVCSDWAAEVTGFASDTAKWREIDPNIPATEWSPEQKAINDAVAPLITANADKLEQIGRDSDNPIFEDMAVLAAQYWRAFASVLPNYSSRDSYLSESATVLSIAVNLACKAA